MGKTVDFTGFPAISTVFLLAQKEGFEAYIFRLNAILAPYFVFGTVFMRPKIKKTGGFCKSPAFFDYLLHFIKVCLYIC